ncbi:hypothetical protein FKW77_001763 [Venturia effusa]|uniref:Uncharacterized protein n=1 Tax=Venturia effusa TaxID=50376 RepID=A0A517LRJ2_9PEZI|nr:hypothetical protein FKW77_001763 [Venturia effusa]
MKREVIDLDSKVSLRDLSMSILVKYMDVMVGMLPNNDLFDIMKPHDDKSLMKAAYTRLKAYASENDERIVSVLSNNIAKAIYKLVIFVFSKLEDSSSLD